MGSMLVTLLVTSLGILSLPADVLACDPAGVTGIAPKNNMKIYADDAPKNGMTEKIFNDVMERIEDLYSPEFEEIGGTFVIERDWKNPTVNAYARRIGTTYTIHMYGGLARHDAVTPEALALVACHEVGHHLGGFPRHSSPLYANEGQADYWGTLKCIRRYFDGDDNLEIIKKIKVDPRAKADCTKVWDKKGKEDEAVCQRSAMAGFSLATLLNDLRRGKAPVDFSKPDPTVVTRTNNSHPAPQCRLDTYFQGTLCTVRVDDKVDEKDFRKGTCNRPAGHKTGLRPLCWFKPPTEVFFSEEDAYAALLY